MRMDWEILMDRSLHNLNLASKRQRFKECNLLNAPWCCWLLYFIICASFASNAAFSQSSPGYTVHGQLRYEAHLADGTNPHSLRNFKVAWQGRSWLIESADPAGNDYELNVWTNGLLHTLRKVNPSKDPTLNDYHEIIEDHELPPPDTSGNAVLWLAFASSSYLGNATNSQYEPIWMLDDPNLREERFTMSGKLDVLRGYLPKELVYLNTGSMIVRASNQRIVLHAPSTFSGAATNAHFQTMEFINVGAREIPTSFIFNRYGINPKDFTAHLLSKTTGTLTHYSATAQLTNEIPQFQGVVFVVDKRYNKILTNAPRISYRVTNQIFIADTDPVLVNQKKIALRSQDLQNGSIK